MYNTEAIAICFSEVHLSNILSIGLRPKNLAAAHELIALSGPPGLALCLYIKKIPHEVSFFYY